MRPVFRCLPFLLAIGNFACPQASPDSQESILPASTSTQEGAEKALAMLDTIWSEPNYQMRQIQCPDGGNLELIVLWCDASRSRVTHETRFQDCSVEGATINGELNQITSYPLPVNAEDHATEQWRSGTLLYSGALKGECVVDLRVADPEGALPRRRGTICGHQVSQDMPALPNDGG